MAKIEKVNVFCDGLCGGNEIEPGEQHIGVLSVDGGPSRQVDLCDECAPLVLALYEKGSPPRNNHKITPTPTPNLTVTTHPPHVIMNETTFSEPEVVPEPQLPPVPVAETTNPPAAEAQWSVGPNTRLVY